jgi:hypothetical protein
VGSRRDVWALALLVVVVLLLTTLAVPREGESTDPRPSTFLTTPGGTRALHDVLGKLGMRAERRLTPWADADPLRGPLVVLAPSQGISPGEVHRVAEWVRGGGTLVYAAEPMERELRDSLGLRLVRFSGDTLTLWNTGDSARAATPAPHRWTQGVPRVDGFRRAWDASSPALRRPGARTVLAAGGRPVAVELPLGRGRVVAWSDARPLTNRELEDGGAATVFARAAAETTGRGRRVYFDEFHHGYRGGGSAVAGTLRFLRTHPWGHASLQWLLAAAGLLLLAGRRFGRALPPPPARRRSPLEHVEALAGAYRQGGARRTARRLLLAGLARRMGRRTPREGAGERETLEKLTSFAGAGPAAAALREEWKKGDAADLVALSRDVDRLLEEAKRT